MKTKMLQACYTVYIPDAVLTHPTVSSALKTLHIHAGGFTQHEVAGAWGDTAEEVTVITWWHVASQDIHELINTLVWAMLIAGEEAVAVEFQDINTPRRMELRTKD
jgi:transcriptional regulator